MMILIVLVSSCNKEKDYPTINFIGGDGLVSQNSVLKKNDTFKVGINSFINSDSKLYNFKVTRIYDNSPQVILDSIINAKNFNTVISFPTLGEENTERWMFSISCEDGYTSEISLLIKSSDSITSINQDKSNLNHYIQRDLPALDMSNVPFYIGFGLLLLIVIGIYIIKKPKRDYNILNIENKLDKLKDFIEEKIDNYENEKRKLEEKLKNSEDRKYLKLLIIMSIISAILLLVIIFHSFVFDIIKYF